MRIDWDLNADALYLHVSDAVVVRQEDHFPVIVDYDESGLVVGVEVLLPVEPHIVREILVGVGVGDEGVVTVDLAMQSGNLFALSKSHQPVPVLEPATSGRKETISEDLFVLA